MTAMLEPIVRSPALDRHIETLLRLRDTERERRGRFIEEMADERKMEFINGEMIVHSPACLRHCSVVLSVKVREGRITSPVVPGFTIPVRAVVDYRENLAALKSVLS